MPLLVADRAFIINLASRADRRQEMQSELDRVGLGGDSAVTFFEAVRPADAGKFPSIGARGCFESHLGVLRAAASAGIERLAIFEDDLDFAPDYAARLPDIVTALEARDWRMFYGGCELARGEADDLRDGPFLRPQISTSVQTTHFVCFRGKETIAAAIALLETFAGRDAGHPEGGPMHVDGAYNWLRRAHPDWLVLVADPPIGVQRSSRSDIAQLRWFDQAPLVRNVVGLLRKLRRR